MNDYKSAFNAMAADISAIIALLGFDKYPGADPVLRAITDLVLAKAEVQQLKGECDAALAANAQMHSMLGVTDQVQAGERIGFLVGQSIMVPKLEARLAALEKQEPLAWVDADWIAQVSDPRGAGCTVRRAYGSAGADLAPVYADPVAQAGKVPDKFSFEYRHPNGERHTVWVSREQVLEQMPDFIFESLCDKFCNCRPVGETNVVECCCDEYAEEFQLVAAAPAQGGE